jgi:hypothetical protein
MTFVAGVPLGVAAEQVFGLAIFTISVVSALASIS